MRCPRATVLFEALRLVKLAKAVKPKLGSFWSRLDLNLVVTSRNKASTGQH